MVQMGPDSPQSVVARQVRDQLESELGVRLSSDGPTTSIGSLAGRQFSISLYPLFDQVSDELTRETCFCIAVRGHRDEPIASRADAPPAPKFDGSFKLHLTRGELSRSAAWIAGYIQAIAGDSSRYLAPPPFEIWRSPVTSLDSWRGIDEGLPRHAGDIFSRTAEEEFQAVERRRGVDAIERAVSPPPELAAMLPPKSGVAPRFELPSANFFGTGERPFETAKLTTALTQHGTVVEILAGEEVARALKGLEGTGVLPLPAGWEDSRELRAWHRTWYLFCAEVKPVRPVVTIEYGSATDEGGRLLTLEWDFYPVLGHNPPPHLAAFRRALSKISAALPRRESDLLQREDTLNALGAGTCGVLRVPQEDAAPLALALLWLRRSVG